MKIARPIYDCIKSNDDKGKSLPFKWTPEANLAFNILKQKLMEAPLLKIPDTRKRFTLYTDGSSSAIGSILTQEHDGLVTLMP